MAQRGMTGHDEFEDVAAQLGEAFVFFGGELVARAGQRDGHDLTYKHPETRTRRRHGRPADARSGIRMDPVAAGSAAPPHRLLVRV